VEQGDHVKKGQVIAKMDDVTLRGQLSAAQGALLMAQDNYEKAIRGNRPQEIAVARLNEMRAKSVVTQAEHNISRLFANVESFTQQTNRDETNAAREAYLALQGAISDQDRLNAVTTARVTRAQLEGPNENWRKLRLS
jgi:multidrug efflux pump subunit AcrA (membrane-fusion protein)